MLDPRNPFTFENQRESIEKTVEGLASLIEDGHDLVLVHGNGPQVGEMLRHQDRTSFSLPIDVLVAQTQGQIGYMLQRELDAVASEAETVSLVTQVVVDSADEAFDEPSKPVGPFLAENELDQEGTYTEVDDGEKPYRRVVPSPEPVSIVEQESIEELLDTGKTVIACGGGGVAVDDEFNGVEAVIDKDRSASLLARRLEADAFIILTDVDRVYRDFDGDREPIDRIDTARLKRLIDSDSFEEGSILPKIEAAIAYAEETGNDAVIGAIDDPEAVLDEDGTIIEQW